MRTVTLSFTLCFMALSVHTKIMVYDDLSELRQLSLPSCENFAKVKFSNIKKDLDRKGIKDNNGAGSIKLVGKKEYIRGVLCFGYNGSRIPSWVDSKGIGYFVEEGQYRLCSDFEPYEWNYMIKLEDKSKCECKATGIDQNGFDVYAAVYVNHMSREIVPGYMKKYSPGIHFIAPKGNMGHSNDNFFVLC